MATGFSLASTRSPWRAVRRITAHLILTLLFGMAMITAGLNGFLAMFLVNFHLQNFWHLFVLSYIFVTPLFSFSAYLVHTLRFSAFTGWISLVASLATLATWFLWTVDASRGLLH